MRLALIGCVILYSLIDCSYCDSPDEVLDLPGWDSPLNYRHFAGYSQISQGNLFYWFIEHSNETSSTIVWLNGGPGCSSLIGGFAALGPFRIKENTNDNEFPYSLEENPYCWANTANLLFFDQPLGTGYSVPNTPEDLATTEEEVAEQFYSGLCNFFKYIHPEYAPTHDQPLFITGESYAGKYIPAISTRILRGGDYTNYLGEAESCVNLYLQGIAIGNGLVDPYWQRASYPQQAYANSFIGTYQRQQADSIALRCQRELLLGQTDDASGLHSCDSISGFIHKAAGPFNDYDIRSWEDSFNSTLIEDYLNRQEVKDAFHVYDANTVYTTCNSTVYESLANDIYVSQVNTVAHILDEYPDMDVLFYNGQFDFQEGAIGTARWLQAMDWEGKSEFTKSPRYQWIVEDQVSGYAQAALGLTYLSVVGAGHFVAEDQPEIALRMIQTFMNAQSFVHTSDSINELCEFLDNCGAPTRGTCVNGRCECNKAFAGFDCSYLIHEFNVDDLFSSSLNLMPLTWVYYSLQLAYESQITIELLATPSFAFYFDKAPPTLDSFLIKGQLISEQRSLKFSEGPGTWFIGVYQTGLATTEFTIGVHFNETGADNYYTDSYYSSGNQSSGGDFPPDDINQEKSNLVYVVIVLSILLFVVLALLVVSIIAVIKKSANNFSIQQWQNDGL